MGVVILRYVKIKLTDEEFAKLEDYCNGFSKQDYCKSKILGKALLEPDFKTTIDLNNEKPDFYFHVQFKLSPEERVMVDDKKGEMSLQEFCRRAVLNKEVVSFSDLKGIKLELSKIGNNINQIARVANKHGIADANLIKVFLDEFISTSKSIKIIEETIKEKDA